jgi:diguanylate cyclase
MNGKSDECERTLAFAEVAVGQMKALRQPAYPRNYEVWYAYATGYNPSLNQSINEALSRNGGTLNAADIDQIYETYLSPARLTDRLDNVGNQIVDEIDRVMGMIDAARGSTSRYGESLAHATQDLGSTHDLEGLRSIVEGLVRATRGMEEHNTRLETSLKASKNEINQLQVNLEAVRNESLTDPLTSLANRKYFDTALDKFIAQSVANAEPMALLLADIDHFKAFNDTYGHLTGDQVLRLVAMALKQNVKGQDIAARYGGEEFAIILPNTTLRSALTVADHVRRAVMTKELMKRSTGEHLGRITVSVGVATLRKDESGPSLIERADTALYAAKRYGRNRVMCETDPEVASLSSAKVA